jgi:hypothetical protein
MAKATAAKAVVKITLELTELEATVLRGLMASIGGNPDNSLRSVTENIKHALAPLVRRASISEFYQDGISNSIYFENHSLSHLTGLINHG